MTDLSETLRQVIPDTAQSVLNSDQHSEFLARLGLPDSQGYSRSKPTAFHLICVKRNAVLIAVELNGDLRICEKFCAPPAFKASVDFDRCVAKAARGVTARLMESAYEKPFGILRYPYLHQIKENSIGSQKMIDVAARINLLNPDSLSWGKVDSIRYSLESNRNYFHRRFLKFKSNLEVFHEQVSNDPRADVRSALDGLEWILPLAESILQRLRMVPRVVSHGDMHKLNFVQRDDKPVVIDYDEWGILPVGTDAARIIFPTHFRTPDTGEAISLARRYVRRLAPIVQEETAMFAVMANAIIVNLHDVVVNNCSVRRMPMLRLVADFRKQCPAVIAALR